MTGLVFEFEIDLDAGVNRLKFREADVAEAWLTSAAAAP